MYGSMHFHVFKGAAVILNMLVTAFCRYVSNATQKDNLTFYHS